MATKEKSVVSLTEFALANGVSKSAISHAVKSGHQVKGIEISKAIKRDSDGSVIGIDLSKCQYPQVQSARMNPAPFTPGQTINITPGTPSVNPVMLADVALRVPQVFTTINALPKPVQLPLYAIVASLAFGALGYFAATEKKKAKYAMIGAGIGATIFIGASLIMDDAEVNKLVTEDRALLGSNLSDATNPLKKQQGGTVNKSGSVPSAPFNPLSLWNQSPMQSLAAN